LTWFSSNLIVSCRTALLMLKKVLAFDLFSVRRLKRGTFRAYSEQVVFYVIFIVEVDVGLCCESFSTLCEATFGLIMAALISLPLSPAARGRSAYSYKT